MKTSILRVSIVLSFTVLLMGVAQPLHAQSISIPLTPQSVRNQMLDFYAGGSSSDGYDFRMSPQGGTMSGAGELTVDWMPWSYVTTQWSTGTVYIIFLVNATQTNFRIGYLYLTNSSTSGFILRWYDYRTNVLSTLMFQGIQQIYNRTVFTTQVQLPRLQISAKSQTVSGINALGSQFRLNSTSGEWLNNTNLFQIYPLYTQFYQDPTDYNEVWSLLSDSQGIFYFAILYMPNNNHSIVIIEHLLRLNDYQKMNGQWVGAKWTKGNWGNTLTVRTSLPDSTVTLNGFPFQTNDVGVLTTGVPAGSLTIEVPEEIQNSANSRTRFLGWSKFGNSNPLNLIVNSSIDIAAKYVQEYALQVNSEYVKTNGTGWYPTGSNVTISVPKFLDFGNGTRLAFAQWKGASSSPSSTTQLIVDSEEEVTAVWKTQYALSISAPGISKNMSINVLVGNDQVRLNGPVPYTEWIDANQQLSIAAQDTLVSGPNGNYSFAGLRADNQTFGGILIVNQPTSVWLMYNQIPTSSAAINVEPSLKEQGTNPDMIQSLSALLLSTNGFSLITQSITTHFRGVPYLSELIGLTTMLVNLGTLLAAPYGPPIAGFFIGSMFIGFVYIFPLTSLVLLYRSAKTKRRPRISKLLPLVVVWSTSLAVVVLSASVNALLPYAALAEMLLVISNALLLPLLAAYRVARLAA